LSSFNLFKKKIKQLQKQKLLPVFDAKKTCKPYRFDTSTVMAVQFPKMTVSEEVSLSRFCGEFGSVEGVQLMIEKFGAEAVINTKLQGGPKPGTSLHYAGGNLRPEIISLLVKNGLDLDQKFEHGETILRKFIRWHMYPSITLLLQMGASLDKAKDSDYDQISFEWDMKRDKIQAAIAKGLSSAPIKEKNLNIAELLNEAYFGDVDGVRQKIKEFGVKAVFEARGMAEMGDNWSPLHYAAMNDQPDMVNLFVVENGVADLDPKDNFGETPLRLAIKYRKYSCVTLLVKLGASLDKAKESNYEKPFTHEFDDSLKEEKTQTAIKAGQ